MVIEHNNTLTLVLFKMGQTDYCYYSEMVASLVELASTHLELHTRTHRERERDENKHNQLGLSSIYNYFVTVF